MGLVSGCHGSHAQNSTDMRALNAVVDAEPLDVLVDDDVKAAAVALGATSGYSEFSSGTRDVKVRSATNSAVLVDKSLTFSSGSNATLVIYGKRNSIGTLLLTDDTTSPSSGTFKIRAAGLSPDAGAVDLYVASSGDISALPPTLSAVSYAAATDYVEVSAGSYLLIFATSGTKDIVFQSSAMALAAGGEFTATVFPSASGRLVNAVLLTAGSGATGTFIPNPLARLKAVNAVPDSAAGLNFKAGGTALLSNVPFGGSSSYITTASGARTLQLEASNVPGSVIASLAQTLDPAKDYTVVAVNALAQAGLVAFPDDNTAPPSGFAKLRFANAMVGSTVVDVLVNFASQTTNLAYKSASPYYPLAADTNYTITFSTSAGITVIASLSPVEIDAGGVYTAYLLGNAGSAQVRLVRDR
jgi:hypothetical protein